jgi:hypothetical protein
MNDRPMSGMVVLGIIALLVGGFIGYAIKGNETSNSVNIGNQAMMGNSDKVMELYMGMRKLWTDHTVWTRDYIIAAVAGSADADAAATRLLKNQDDIGNAVASYYGREAGEQLAALLKEHILIAVDLIKAAKANDSAKVNEMSTKWQNNGNDIADFLSKANPNWPQAELRAMMRTHLDTTTKEVTARISKNWNQDIAAYDAVYDHILEMSDALSAGIIKQFPEKF